jgi:hypothetical protein
MSKKRWMDELEHDWIIHHFGEKPILHDYNNIGIVLLMDLK